MCMNTDYSLLATNCLTLFVSLTVAGKSLVSLKVLLSGMLVFPNEYRKLLWLKVFKKYIFSYTVVKLSIYGITRIQNLLLTDFFKRSFPATHW